MTFRLKIKSEVRKSGSEGGLVDFIKVGKRIHCRGGDVGRSSFLMFKDENVWTIREMIAEFVLNSHHSGHVINTLNKKRNVWSLQKRAPFAEKVVWKSIIQWSCNPRNQCHQLAFDAFMLHLMRLCLAGYMERTCFMLAHLERRCTSFNLGA